MNLRRPTTAVAAALAASLALSGCTGLPPPAWPAGGPREGASVDGSLVCQSLAQRFVGLPTTAPLPWEDVPPTPTPSAGRWWVRSCSARTLGAQLEVDVQGPGSYWVDEARSGLRVRQQVPFELGVLVRGRFHMTIEGGVVSLGFRPSTEPVVRVQSPPELNVRTENAWGALLSITPGVSPARRAAQRFNDELSRSLRDRVRGGATFTYALGAGQADATLGLLSPGETPRHPFTETAWVFNDRLLFGPGATQLLGPIEPGLRQMNVIVERGPGVSYRAICQGTLPESYSSIVSGGVDAVAPSAWVSGGTVSGLGEHTVALRVPGCRYYLVTWGAGSGYTLASILVS